MPGAPPLEAGDGPAAGVVVAVDLGEEGGERDRRGEDPVAALARLVGDGPHERLLREGAAEEQFRVEDEGPEQAAELSTGGGGGRMRHGGPSVSGRGREITPIGLEEGSSFYLQTRYPVTTPEVPFEFKRFVNAIILMPCQIVRGGHRLLYRLLSWNEWQGVFLRVVHALRC